MRLGIFSDVHANLEALYAVIEAYKSERIDRYYCLGDVVGYGANPNECTNIVREVAELTILGNHDAAVAGRMDYSYYYEAARHALDAHAQSLTPDNMAWLRGLPYKHRVPDANVLLCHGSPVRIEEFETSSRRSRLASACRSSISSRTSRSSGTATSVRCLRSSRVKCASCRLATFSCSRGSNTS
jgi:predicted phosphodiesterase